MPHIAGMLPVIINLYLASPSHEHLCLIGNVGNHYGKRREERASDSSGGVTQTSENRHKPRTKPTQPHFPREHTHTAKKLTSVRFKHDFNPLTQHTQ